MPSLPGLLLPSLLHTMQLLLHLEWPSRLTLILPSAGCAIPSSADTSASVDALADTRVDVLADGASPLMSETRRQVFVLVVAVWFVLVACLPAEPGCPSSSCTVCSVAVTAVAALGPSSRLGRTDPSSIGCFSFVPAPVRATELAHVAAGWAVAVLSEVDVGTGNCVAHSATADPNTWVWCGPSGMSLLSAAAVWMDSRSVGSTAGPGCVVESDGGYMRCNARLIFVSSLFPLSFERLLATQPSAAAECSSSPFAVNSNGLHGALSSTLGQHSLRTFVVFVVRGKSDLLSTPVCARFASRCAGGSLIALNR